MKHVPLNRRRLIAGVGSAALVAALPRPLIAAPARSLLLRAATGSAALRPGQPETSVARLTAQGPEAALRFRRGEQLTLRFENALSEPTILGWRGLAEPGLEPLLARRAVAAAGNDAFAATLRHAGTAMVDLRLLGDGGAEPLPARAVIVEETEPVAVDRDEVLLIEDWRLAPDGRALAPGRDAKDAATVYTVNGAATPEIKVRAGQRLRIRFINGCQRAVAAVKIEDHDCQVMAIDGQPAEPFPARGGQLVLAPGTRVDGFVDALRPPGSSSAILLHDGTTARPIARLVYSGEPPVRAGALPPAAPLPGNGLPAQLDLKAAQRVDLALDVSQPIWQRPVDFKQDAAPAFRTKRGRTVVLALSHRAAGPMVFHLHGHHVRLLDRLDDGWKPYWLDTLVVGPGQTQRVAFAADTAGPWLLEAMATEWSAPRMVATYLVD
ncbi:FtsP/CotA-like multicopper oxidase with cupredoxin domain [Rhodopseudomonas rhenobacensis]|uniref:FtsP/CotA-like multicopper oxidase with cupredoxin domain n=1 Tax=Rhodopseudomonas rhenobacensis TaxID=87461 RepID=A0A7W7Z1P2_9BRAD|nr:FtsP/CotA-like multicopper oxidase with cupredoxin domain [Rhodopseudomonas rhenobacensis]